MADQEFFRDTAETGREDVIQAGTFGGLNTTANVLNLPWTDSHEMRNVDVSVGGNVMRRKGTRLVGNIDAQGFASVNNFVLGSGLPFIIVKNGTSLQIFEVVSDVLEELHTFPNVWSGPARGEHPGVVSTNESEPRLLFFTNNNAPVQLHAVELSEQVLADDTQYEITDRGNRFDGATTIGETFFCYKNAIRQPTSSYERDGSILRYTDSVATDDVITFVNFTWQWWAEAELYSVTRFYDVRTRFGHIDRSDRLISIPDTLRDGVELDTYNLYRLYCAYGGLGDRDDSYFRRRIQPADSFAYTTSNGVLNRTGASWDIPPVGSTHFLFGGDLTTSPPASNPIEEITLHMMRIRKLTMNGGGKIAPFNLQVEGYDFAETYPITQAGELATTDPWGYLLFDGDDWTEQDPTVDEPGLSDPDKRIPVPLEPASLDPGNYVMLDRGERRGAPLEDLVRFINKEARWVGSAAVETVNRYKVGHAVPAYGFGRFANYGTGQFPNAGAIYSGRLVLGGVPSDPMRVLFSAITDTEFPGDTYQGFTIDPFINADTGAFDLNLSGSTSEIVVSLSEFQGSVFVGTSESLYRAFSRSALNSQNVLTQLTGKVGALNSDAFSIADGQLFYLSREGVYTVVPSDGLDDSYTVQDISFKIRNVITQEDGKCSRQFSNISYDSQTKKLYVSVYTSSNPDCSKGGTELFVLHTERMAWTQYSTFERWRIVDMVQYRDTSGTRRFMINTMSPQNDKLRMIRTEWIYPIDFAQIVIDNTSGTALAPYVTVQNTIVDVQRYTHDIETTGFNDVEDLIVTLDGEVLEFGTQWTKQGRNSIYLRETPDAVEELTITSVSPESGHEQLQVYRNLQPIEEGSGYEISGTALAFDDDSAEHMFGNLFFTVFRTPVFTWGLLANYKRAIKWSGLFDNRPNEVRYGTELFDRFGADDAAQLVGSAVVETDTNISIIYNNEREGSSSYDIFRLSELIYDISLFDSYGGPYTQDDYVQIVEPLQGTGYSVQVALWSYDRNTFVFSGYQLIAQKKGKRYSGDNR